MRRFYDDEASITRMCNRDMKVSVHQVPFPENLSVCYPCVLIRLNGTGSHVVVGWQSVGLIELLLASAVAGKSRDHDSSTRLSPFDTIGCPPFDEATQSLYELPSMYPSLADIPHGRNQAGHTGIAGTESGRRHPPRRMHPTTGNGGR